MLRKVYPQNSTYITASDDQEKAAKDFDSRFDQNQCICWRFSLVNLSAQTESSDVFLMSMDAFGDLRNKLNQLFSNQSN